MCTISLPATAFVNASAYEDFTTYTEIDPNEVITVNPSHVCWEQLDRSCDTHVYKSYGSGFFGDFEIQFEFGFKSIEAGDGDYRNIVRLLLLSNDEIILPTDYICLYAEQIGSSDDKFRLVFLQGSGGTGEFVYVGRTFSAKSTFYVRVTRRGIYCRMRIYADADHTNLLEDTGDIEGVSTRYEYVAIGIRKMSNDPYDWSTGYLANLLLEVFQKTDTKLSFELNPNPAQLGDTIKMTGNLVDEYGQPMQSSQVSVYYSIDGGVRWIYAGTLLTNSTGWFKAKGKITVVGYYFVAVVFRGTPEYTLSYHVEKLIMKLP